MTSFNKIPGTLRVPGVYTEIDSRNAVSGTQLLALRVLLLGQKLGTGTAVALTPVPVTSVEQARAQFGAGSMLATMAEAALASNPSSEIVALPITDNVAGTVATASVTFGGAPTAAGTVSLYIAGRKVDVPVATTSTPAALATLLAGLINDDTGLCVTAVVDGVNAAKVNLSARHKGEAYNGVDVRAGYFGETLPAGLTVATSSLTGGTGNPDITAALAAIGDQWYHLLAMPYTDAANLAVLETELASRFDPAREIETHAIAAASGALGTLSSLGNSRNSPHLTIVAARGEPTPAFAKAAETAAIVALYASADPARPLQTLPYAFCKAPAAKDRFTQQEREILLHDGIATTYVDAGGVICTERLITTYKTNANGADDTAYLDVETLLTLTTIRHDWRDSIRRKYPRHKLANDGTRFAAGQAVVTPNVIKAEAISKFREWEQLGLVENFDQFKADLVVERNQGDPNRMDVVLPPDIINGLRVVGTLIAFRL